MNPEEIRLIAIESAERYYKYLDENNKGVQTVDIFEVRHLNSENIIVKLRLSAKLFDTEAIFFYLRNSDKRYDTTQIKVIEYDIDKNILLVKPSTELEQIFSQLKNTDIYVISDLKFLVTRVKAWYERNGASIALPRCVSPISDMILSIRFIEGLSPSINQRESLKSIFSNPFAYVWGPPGTGKTKYVLAYAILHYISKKRKVAILAPTNNALEQVLDGVIDMTDKAGIERSKIIRLGTPTSKFAGKYTEVCEEKGVQKKLEEVDNQITILKRVVEFSDRKKKLDIDRQTIGVISQLKDLAENVVESEHQVSVTRKVKKEIEIDIRNAKIDLRRFEEEKRNLEREIVSIKTRIKKFFSKAGMSSETELKEIENRIREKSKDIEVAHYSLFEIDTDIGNKEQLLHERSSMANQFIVSYKDRFTGDKVFSPIVETLDVSNWEKIRDRLLEEFVQEERRIGADELILDEYEISPTSEKASLRLATYQQMRAQLSRASTEERIKSVSVIACTLDGYIGRNLEEKLNVDHIFLDEAGYANIIKALTLFNHSVPITFLGDHKQLPPVCEIGELNLGKDDTYKNMFLWSQSAIYLERLFSKNRDEILFELYQNNPSTADVSIQTTLNSTYRFGSNLASVLEKNVYHGLGFNSQCRNGETRINYIHAPKIEGFKSRVSSNEGFVIERFVNKLKQSGKTEFVILTPYTKQVKVLGNLLPQERNDLRILTVHGSQGKEWDIVILSVVDT